MRIRLAVESDLPQVRSLFNHYIQHSAASFAIEPVEESTLLLDFRATSPMHAFLVAEARADPVGILGFARTSPWKSRCAYAWAAESTVYVQPDQHRKNIGRALYTRLTDIARAQGYATLIAGIADEQPASSRLHEACGFAKVGTFQGVGYKHDAWHSVTYWQLMLTNGSPPARVKSVQDAIAHLDRQSATQHAPSV